VQDLELPEELGKTELEDTELETEDDTELDRLEVVPTLELALTLEETVEVEAGVEEILKLGCETLWLLNKVALSITALLEELTNSWVK
jgi:hypothetical protein